jgi:predicted nucleic acid-binding protein
MADVVLDASALVDLLLGNAEGEAVKRRLRGERLHAPAHLDAEVLSALGRLYRAGSLNEDDVPLILSEVPEAVIRRHPLRPLLRGAWSRRHRLRLADALYVELAAELGMLVTTDRRLRDLPMVDVVEGEDS